MQSSMRSPRPMLQTHAWAAMVVCLLAPSCPISPRRWSMTNSMHMILSMVANIFSSLLCNRLTADLRIAGSAQSLITDQCTLPCEGAVHLRAAYGRHAPFYMGHLLCHASIQQGQLSVREHMCRHNLLHDPPPQLQLSGGLLSD
mmetsp:Transcript_21708/g.59685  ORF Transcript_21708/g.59685 Transcript_21708/m.59685 type:complete len:144 (-) Transcript_21708:212-643(-)